MRFMVMVKATRNSEAGMMPSEQLLADMGRFNEELDREEKLMLYMDPRANNYYRNAEFNRSCVNGPIDYRRMWKWLRDPRRPAPNETDAGLKPYFGGDLVVG